VRTRIVILLLLVLGGVALAAAPVDFAASPGSTVSYLLIHKFHEVKGTSQKVQARARVLPEGSLQVMVRTPVASFDSGNGNRDEHMQETVDAARFPNVELKAVASGVKLPATFPATLEVPLDGELTFHGVTRPLKTTATLTFADARHVVGETQFAISLEAFGIDRPSLAFVKVDDQLQLSVHLVFEAQP
jgi:polyisoprenoid-binding protein YceI